LRTAEPADIGLEYTVSGGYAKNPVIVTAMKNRVRFIRYGIDVVRARLRGERLPLPLAATPDPS
jgi:hypothetical protein